MTFICLSPQSVNTESPNENTDVRRLCVECSQGKTLTNTGGALTRWRDLTEGLGFSRDAVLLGR